MHIRHFSLYFSYESCFGNNIVTTSVNLLYLAWVLKGTPSLSSHWRVKKKKKNLQPLPSASKI